MVLMCQISRSKIPNSSREVFAVHGDTDSFWIGKALRINGRGAFLKFKEFGMKRIEELTRGDFNQDVE
jgi:hypothetical protein